MNAYTFHVSIPGGGRTWRKLELTGEQTLEDLHLAIQDAFEFDNDHLYSFFMSGKAWDQASEYSLPEGVSPWGEDMFGLVNGGMGSNGMQETPVEDEPELTPEEREALIQAEAKKFGMSVEQFRALMESFEQAMEAAYEEEEARDVRNARLDDLKLKVGKEFLYLFDYGDEWRFKVKVHAINKNAPEGEYPRLVESVGDPPEQYPSWDEDDEDEFDDEES